jgi:hypothetical protein
MHKAKGLDWDTVLFRFCTKNMIKMEPLCGTASSGKVLPGRLHSTMSEVARAQDSNVIARYGGSRYETGLETNRLSQDC